MDITKGKIEDLARELHYGAPLVETTVRLLDILDAFAADDVVAPRMALKGGTALNAFHLPLPRLSFDIDINYVGAADWSAMMDDKPRFESRVISIMEAKGYRVQNAPPKGRGKWTFRCAAAMGGETSLHVDFNYQARIPLFNVQRLPSVCRISPTYHPNFSQSSRSISLNVATQCHHGSHPERSDAIRPCWASWSPLLFRV